MPSRQVSDSHKQQCHGCGTLEEAGRDSTARHVQDGSSIVGVSFSMHLGKVHPKGKKKTFWPTSLAICESGYSDRMVSSSPGVRHTWRDFSHPHIYLFGVRTFTKLPIFRSPAPDPMVWKQDAFQHPWDNLSVYVFPLLQHVLSRVLASENLSMILDTPLWSQEDWLI